MNKYYLLHNVLNVILIQAINIAKLCDVIGDDPIKQCYVREILITMSHNPNQFAVDKITNTLYFSFDTGHGDYIPALYKIETKELTVLKGVKDAFAIYADADKQEIYFGGSYGIYKYNTVNKVLKRLNFTDLDIWWLFVKKNVYFIKFPSLNAYVYVNGSISPIADLRDNEVHHMVMDMEDNIFFMNNTGLFGVEAIGNDLIFLKDEPRLLSMATDNDGNVYVCTEDGIYSIGKPVRRIANINDVLGFTFDKYNYIVYSDSREIARLVPLSKPFY